VAGVNSFKKKAIVAIAHRIAKAIYKIIKHGDTYRDLGEDYLSAPSKQKVLMNLNKRAKEDVTKRYEELFTHYGLIPTRNNRGKGHENGGVESPHGHLKNRIRQTLLLRNSVDFESVSAYQQWVDILIFKQSQIPVFAVNWLHFRLLQRNFVHKKERPSSKDVGNYSK